MKQFIHTFEQLSRLFRLPNLLILALLQFFIRYGIFYPIFSSRGVELQMSLLDFSLLVLSTILITAGGYVINDFYDVQMDNVNRPEKVVAGKFISLRKLNLLYYLLTICGCIIGVYIAYGVGSIKLGFIHFVSSLVLFYYSLKYKRMLFWGNFSIAALSALSVLIVWLFEFFALKKDPLVFGELIGYFRTLNILVFGYAFFAFYLTLIREIIKDAIDIEGDQASKCRTIPIVLGIKKTRRILLILSIIFGGFLAFSSFELFSWNYSETAWYFSVVIGGLWLYFIFLLNRAGSKKEFHFLSNLLKIIMVAGILSLQLLYIGF